MSKHYIYNCLVKNDINLLWIATLLSFVHFLCFYQQEGIFSIVTISIVALISTITLALSIRMKVVLNLRQSSSFLILGAVFLSVFLSIQYKTNEISSVFINMLGMFIIFFSVINIKEIIYTKKLNNLASNDKQTIAEYSILEMISLYKLKIHEIIRLEHGVKNNYGSGLDKKYSLFFDYRLNMIVDDYEMTTLDDSKVYSLHDFANYCKEHEINTTKMTKEDFEVYKMMII